ncbi:hypothetical protein HD806DRAFT_550582 [Xylariaceae sp. AK1471]|nr:hypothetical protein HD806DRAFT_550582 [Xylariaceae sp. AK1471]
MWYRIIGQDRYPSLVLGPPPGTAKDLSLVSQAQMTGNCATGQLQRQHYNIMGKIAGRSALSGETVDDDFTRNISLALHNAAQSIPTSWWLIPRARYTMQSRGVDNASNLEDVGRILVRINHYNLLVTLHLPSILNGRGTHANDYRPTTYLNSSRELLSRYVRLRCIRIALFRCHTIDLYAMDSLAHQHLSDRATVEETTRLLLETSKFDSDTAMLQQAAAIRKCHSSRGTKSHRSVRVKAPFMGTVTISAKGITTGLSECPPEKNASDHQNTDYWSYSLHLPLSPSVSFFQEYRAPNELNLTPANNVVEMINSEQMP